MTKTYLRNRSRSKRIQCYTIKRKRYEHEQNASASIKRTQMKLSDNGEECTGSTLKRDRQSAYSNADSTYLLK